MAQSSTTTKLVDAAGANRAKVGTGGDQAVSLTNPTAAPYGIYASINPYGSQRVTVEPTTVFFDPFDGVTLDTNRWATAGTQVPTQTGGAVALAPTIGASVANNAVLTSVPTFVSPGVGFLVFSGVVTLEAAQTNVVNVHRFWGKGQVTSFAYATPITDGIGFEVEGATGALQCVMYVTGTKYVLNSSTAANISSSVAGAGGSGTALPSGATGSNYGAVLPWRGGPHRYAIMIRSDIAYWFVEGQDAPVAAASYVTPNTQGLPLRFHSITNNAATSLANTFQIGAFAVNDATAQNSTISDATYQWRRTRVDASGNLAVTTQASTVASNGPTSVTGAAVDTLLLAANTVRRGATVFNDSTANLFLSLGTNAASATAYTVRIAPNGYYEVPFGYTGQIRGIWSAANGAARITEVTG